MGFTVYSSLDASAPVLTGETGKLIELLNACLVVGYGAKAAAGWTKPFNTGIAVAVYQNGATGSNRYWRVRDDGPNGTSTFKEAWIRGYATKSDVNDTEDAGNTGPFPTAAQKANGLVIRKSAAADATARDWYVYADARTCILFVYTGDNAGQAMIHYFGDFYDWGSVADINAYNGCRNTENSASQTIGLQQFTVASEQYLMQSYTGSGGSVATLAHPVSTFNGNLTYSSGVTPFPNQPNGAKYLTHLAVAEGGTSATTQPPRGVLRGLWYPISGQATYTDLNTLEGSGPTAGRTFTVHVVGGGRYAVETSDTLDTN